MKTKPIILLFTLFVIPVLLSACTGRTMVASGWAGVTSDEENAYLAFNNHVYAINLANGVERWRYPAEADVKITFYAQPALTNDGQLIIGAYDNKVYSLNPLNGQLNWTFDDAEGRFIASPLVTEAGIFIPSADKKLYALDLNGAKLWEPFETGEPIWASPAMDDQCECIFLASMDHKIYALDPETGQLFWTSEDLGGAIVNAPLISEDHQLFVGTFNNEVVALNTDSGSVLWRFATQNWAWAGQAILNDRIFTGDLSGTFYAIDRNSGTQVWQIQPGTSIVGTPLATNEAIYFTTQEGSLVSTTPDGAINWTQTLEGNTHAGPIYAGDIILVPSSAPEELLIAFDTNGVQKWSFGSEK